MAESKSAGDVQRAFVDGLRDLVAPQQFQRWFQGARVEREPSGRLIVFVENKFVSDWIESYYADVVEEVARRVCGPDAAVHVAIDDGAAARSERSTDEAPSDDGRASGPAGGREAPAEPPRRRRSRLPRGGAGAGGGRAELRRADLGHSEMGHADVGRRAGARLGGSQGFGPPAGSMGGSELFGHPRYRHFLSDVILNDDYRFETFVEGPSNQLAHAAAGAVSNNPGNAYNPLFLHGAVGLGKTHLLQAICSRYLQQNPDARVIYLSCESFVNQFIAAVAEGQIQDFRYRYRHVDLLLIDDIHFLARKDRTQEEFFHTFNTLYNSKKQIVLSCDSPPVEIPTLEDRLVSRFRWGLVAEIESPDHETRVSIVRKKAERRGMALPDDVALYVADHITANVRELEGAVLRICSYASLSGRPVTLELAQESLRDLVRPKERKISTETILRVVGEHFGVKVSELLGKRRHKSVSFPRQVAMYLARRLTDYSLVEVGFQFGGRDHTTVMYANDKIATALETNARLHEELELLVRKIRGAS